MSWGSYGAIGCPKHPHSTLLRTVSHQLVLLYCTYCTVLLLTPPACPLSELHRYACTTPRLHAYTPTYLHVSIHRPNPGRGEINSSLTLVDSSLTPPLDDLAKTWSGLTRAREIDELVATSFLDFLLHEHLMLNCCSSPLFSMKLPAPVVISNLSQIRLHAAKDPSAGTFISQITSTPPAKTMNTFPLIQSSANLVTCLSISSFSTDDYKLYTFLVHLQRYAPVA